jgi:hypothetical protein
MRQWFNRANSSDKILFKEAMYTLESATEVVPAPGTFQPETYLMKNANITDATTDPPKSFVYDSNKGGVEYQRKYIIDSRSAGAESASQKSRTGLSALILATLMAGIWTVWKLSRMREMS